jgi:hypothetical protein
MDGFGCVENRRLCGSRGEIGRDLHVSPKQANKNEILDANKDVLPISKEGVVLEVIVGNQNHHHRELR